MSNITFRELEEKDLPFRVRWFNNPTVSEYLGGAPDEPVTLESQKKWHRHLTEGCDKHFLILYDEMPIGQVALIDLDEDNHFANLFIFIGDEEYRGRGIAQEAMKFITEYGFQTLHLHKIGIEVIETNQKAIKAYLRFGFIEEARLRDRHFMDEKYYDNIVMAMFNPIGV